MLQILIALIILCITLIDLFDIRQYGSRTDIYKTIIDNILKTTVPNLDCGSSLELPPWGGSNETFNLRLEQNIIKDTPVDQTFPYKKCGLPRCSLHELANGYFDGHNRIKIIITCI